MKLNTRSFYGGIAGRFLTAIAIVVGMLVVGTTANASTSSVSSTGGVLDISAYCSTHLPYQNPEQQLNVFPAGYRGDAHKNNWACTYNVFHVIPLIGYGDEIGGIPFPLPTTEHFPIDFNTLCKEQYPGTHARWIPAPATGYFGEPWACVN